MRCFRVLKKFTTGSIAGPWTFLLKWISVNCFHKNQMKVRIREFNEFHFEFLNIYGYLYGLTYHLSYPIVIVRRLFITILSSVFYLNYKSMTHFKENESRLPRKSKNLSFHFIIHTHTLTNMKFLLHSLLHFATCSINKRKSHQYTTKHKRRIISFNLKCCSIEIYSYLFWLFRLRSVQRILFYFYYQIPTIYQRPPHIKMKKC